VTAGICVAHVFCNFTHLGGFSSHHVIYVVCCLNHHLIRSTANIIVADSVPKDIHIVESESYQRYECTYLGRVETKSAYGMDTIVESLTKLIADDLKWIEVYVDIASSHIKILNRLVCV